jgi:hypothetical protein
MNDENIDNVDINFGEITVNHEGDDETFTLRVNQVNGNMGVVIIRDSVSDIQANVIRKDNKNALLVYDIKDETKQAVNIFHDEIISPDSTLTLSEYTVPTDKHFVLQGAMVGGNQPGIFYFKVDSDTIAIARNSGSERTVVFSFPQPFIINTGKRIYIEVKNIGNITETFETTLSGYVVEP